MNKSCLTCKYKNFPRSIAPCSDCYAYANYEQEIRSQAEIESKNTQRKLQLKWENIKKMFAKHNAVACVKYGDYMYYDAPSLNLAFDDYESAYIFPLGVVEGKPVFNKSKLFNKNGEAVYATSERQFDEDNPAFEQLYWLPPKYHKDISINGVYFKAPQVVKSDETVKVESVLYFSSIEDANTANDIIVKAFGVK